MNANELNGIEVCNDKQIAEMDVNHLVEYLNGWYSTAAPRKAATMLRQQQAEIEALEQSKDRLIKTLLDVREQQPVAWGMTWKDGEIYDVISPAQHDKEEGDYNIPLYAHPVKELHLSLQKSKQTGELLAVTYTDDEHRIVEVLWQRPPELTDEEIHQAIRRGFARDGFLSDGIFLEIKELLRNTQGVNSEQVPDFFFMENDLMGKR